MDNQTQDNNELSNFKYESNALAVFFNQFSILGRNIGTALALYGIIIGVIFAAAIIIALVFVLGVSLGDSGLAYAIPLVLGGLLVVFLAFVSVLFQVAFVGYTLATVRGEEYRLSDGYALAKKRGLGFIGVSLLYGLIIIGGLLLFIVPGIIFAYWYAYAQLLYVDDHSLTVGGALSKSREITKGKFWEIAGMYGTNLIIQFVGNVPFLGAIVAMFGTWVYSLAFAHRYASDRYITEAQIEKPNTHWANYLITLSGPVLFAISLAIIIIIQIDSL